MLERSRQAAAVVALLTVATVGMTLRAVNLGHPPLSLDEAESAVNALTILQHGYPTDRYLGLPLYENTLVRPWPEHPEYEFRDVSYSDKGVAVYHGWLPLYAIAGSFACAGVSPDEPANPPRVLHDLSEMRRRTVAARVPAVLFGAAFLAVVYFAARDMFGRPAAAVALVVAALADPCVRVAREARYYSATLAVATLCCWAVWGVCRRGRRREFLLAAAALAMAFHTHVPTFAIGCVALAVASPWWLRRPGAWRMAAASGATVALCTVPWVIAVGYFDATGARHIPSARSLLVLPDDLITYLRGHVPLVVIAAGAAAALLLTARPVAVRIPPRLTAPIREMRGGVALTLAWLVLGAAVFVLFMPASSAFFWRMTLPIQGAAAMLLGALVAGSASVVIGARHAGYAAVLVAAGLVARPGTLLANFRHPPPLEREPIVRAIDHLRGLQLTVDTKLYAIPLQHFPLMFYTGLPVQSVAPVRRAFLERYPGDVILIDSAPRGIPVPRALVAAAAADEGQPITADEARAWEQRLASRILREDLASRVARVEPPPEPLPPFAREAVRRARGTAARPAGDGRWQNPAIFRTYESYHRADFWPIFFYRFVDPRARSGDGLNYADRVRNATATVLPGGWVIFHSPGVRFP